MSISVLFGQEKFLTWQKSLALSHILCGVVYNEQTL